MNASRRTALAVAVLVALGACGGSAEQAAPQPSPSVTVPSPIPTVDPTETVFVGMLRRTYPAMTNEEGQRAVAAAKLVCTDLDGGMTVHDLNVQVVLQRVDPTWAAAVVGYGVGAFCPQHLSQLR